MMMLVVLMMMIEGHPADANNASLPHIERMIEPKWPPLRTVGIKNFWSQMCFEKLNSFFSFGLCKLQNPKDTAGLESIWPGLKVHICYLFRNWSQIGFSDASNLLLPNIWRTVSWKEEQ